MKYLIRFSIFLCVIGSTVTATAQQIRHATGVGSYSSNYGGLWGIDKILGEPDVYPRYGDLEGSWAFTSIGPNPEFITVSFSDPIPISSIAIYETFGTGGIDSVFISNPISGEWELVFSQSSPVFAGNFSRKTVFNFDLTEFPVDSVRFTVNTNLYSSYEEYDAVAVADYDLTPNHAILFEENFRHINYNYVFEFLQTDQQNIWFINENPYQTLSENQSDKYGIFISDLGNGTSAIYNNTIASQSAFYRDIDFPNYYNKFTVEFDWINPGESEYDYLVVYLADTTENTAETFSNPIGTYEFSDVYNDRHEVIILGDELSGQTKRLVFLWINDESVGEKGAFIDNIRVTGYDPTPMSGNYYVGNNRADYLLEQVLTKLYINGVANGGVTIKMEAGIYDRAIDFIHPISGVDYLSYVVIEPLNENDQVVFSNYGYGIENLELETTSFQRKPDHNWIVRLWDQNYIKFNNIIFSSDYVERNIEFDNKFSRLIYLANSKAITFDNCTFVGANPQPGLDPYHTAGVTLDLDRFGSLSNYFYEEESPSMAFNENKVSKIPSSHNLKKQSQVITEYNEYTMFYDNSFYNLGAAVYAERRVDSEYLPQFSGPSYSASNAQLVSNYGVDANVNVIDNLHFYYSLVQNCEYGVFASNISSSSVNLNEFIHDDSAKSAIFFPKANGNMSIVHNKFLGSFDSGLSLYYDYDGVNNSGYIYNNIFDLSLSSETGNAMVVVNGYDVNIWHNTIFTSGDLGAAVLLDNVNSFLNNVVTTTSGLVVQAVLVDQFDYNDLYQENTGIHPLLDYEEVFYNNINDFNNSLENGQIHNFSLDYRSDLNLDGSYRPLNSNINYLVPTLESLTYDFFYNDRGVELTLVGAVEYDATVPVELSAFTYSLVGNSVVLNWTTSTETNNLGFEIERKSSTTSSWATIGFVAGKGTTTEPQSYVFNDQLTNFSESSISYRLKQIDVDGNFKYSQIKTISLVPERFTIVGNYPNPFNPSTTIKFQLPNQSVVEFKVFNTLGQLVFEQSYELSAGTVEIPFNGQQLSSGLYMYSLTVNQKTMTKTMLLVK